MNQLDQLDISRFHQKTIHQTYSTVNKLICMSDTKFIEKFQSSLNDDYIKTLKSIPLLRSDLIKSLTKHINQLPSVSKKPYTNINKILFQLDTYDQVSSNLYQYNEILQQLISLFNIVINTDGVVEDKDTKSMYKLNNNSSGNLLAKTKKHTFSNSECNLIFKVFGSNLIKKFVADERDFDYCKDINTYLIIISRIADIEKLETIAYNFILMNAKVFVLGDDCESELAEQVVLNKKILNTFIKSLIKKNQVDVALKLILELRKEDDLLKDFVRQAVLGVDESSFNMDLFNFMNTCYKSSLFQDVIKISTIRNKLLNHIMWLHNNLTKVINFERMNVLFEIIVCIRENELYEQNIGNVLLLLRNSLEAYIKNHSDINKTSLFKLVNLIVSELLSFETEQNSGSDLPINIEYIEPEYNLWSPLWEDEILKKLDRTDDNAFIQWVGNNTKIKTNVVQQTEDKFESYIFEKFNKHISSSSHSADVKSFTLSKDVRKRLIVHNMGILISSSLFDIKYLINDKTKSINFIIQYKLGDDSINTNMLDFECGDNSGLLHVMGVNTLKILRVQNWPNYKNELTILRFKVLMDSGKKYIFDVEFRLSLNKLFVETSEINKEQFEGDWKNGFNKLIRTIDATYDKLVIHLGKLKKYNLKVLNNTNDCFYLKASLQTIELKTIDVLCTLRLNNRLNWDAVVCNNILGLTNNEKVNETFMELLLSI